MSQRYFLKIMAVAAIFFILPLASFTPSVQAAYNYSTVYMPGSDSTKAQDINDAGMVVGHYFSGGTTWYGFTFDGTTYTSYEMPGSGATRFIGINDTGLITGEYYADVTDWSGFIYDGITWTSFVVPDAARTDPRGINDSGYIAGWNRESTYCAAYGFLYDGGSLFTTIDYPGTDESACFGGSGPLDETRVLDINDAGKLVGFYVIDNALHGFTYEGGTYNTFDYPAWPESYATGINDSGQIVGAYNDNGTWKTYVYDNGSWSEIFIAGSTYTIATGINNNGVITGYYNDGTRENGFIATPSVAVTATIPQSGQTTLYLTGDDGDLQMGAAWPATGNMGSGRFNDNGDGTVTDLLTGLMWTLNANQIRPAVGTPTYENMNDYINNTFNVSGGGFAGYNDWRIPNTLELESLINYGAVSPAAWLSGEGFTNVQAAEYWVSTVYAVNQGGWTINLGIGETNYWLTRVGGPTDRYVWTVRGGANGAAGGFPAEVRKTGQTVEVLPRDDGALEWGVTAWDAGRFTDNADGTMTDNLTGLMWTKDGSMVSTLTGIDAMGITQWDRALDFVDYMNTGQSFCSSSIEPCSVDGDCAGNGTTGYCTNNPYNRCTDANDCIIGSCSTIDRRCELPPNNICTDHNQCPGSTNFCVNLKRCSVSTNVYCRNDSQCPGGETCATTTCIADNECINPAEDSCKGVEGCVADGGETCLPAPDNYGYDNWYLPNFKEVYSMTHWETERFDDDLAAYGFTNVGGPPTTQPGRGCGIWTSTTYAADTTSVLSTAFGWAAGQIRSYPKDTAGQQFCGVSNQYPYIVWPVRTAFASEPDISVTPNSYDFGGVMQGTDSDVTFTISNIGNGNLSIINIAQIDTFDPPFSLVSGQDNCTGTVVGPGASCTFDVHFSPIGRSSYNDTFDIQSNDPDTSTFIVSITGTGTTAYTLELPQTGQIISQSAGDDGDLQMGAAWPATGNMGSGRFNDNGDGTVTDLLTGLMWTLNANQIRPAVGTPTYENMNDYINNTFNVSGGGFAGYSDWRIPNTLELESLINYGAVSPAAWLSGEGFTNVQAAEYWVSTVYAVNQGGWTINLGIGETNYWLTRVGGPTDRYVWTVRGGANGAAGGFPAEVRKTGQTVEVLPRDDGALEWGVTAWDAGRFTDNADGTMTDNLTGLMWTKDGSMVSTLTGIDAMGITQWDRALDFVDYMNTGQSFCSSSIEPCSVDGDCAGNGTTGYCTNNPYNRCTDANDCIIGSCSTIDRRCELPPNNICTDHNQCPGSTNFCVNLKRCSVSTNVYCRLDSQCPGGETCATTTCIADNECINPAEDSCKGVEGCVADGGETCLAAPDNYGYDDWYLPNFKEVYSMTHWETERFDDDLAAYGFMNIGGPPTTQPGRGCGIWTSTTYAADTASVLSTAFGWAAGQIRSYPKDTAGLQFCGVSNQYPYIVWPVRTAPAPEPDISVTPNSYDFGNVDIGVTSNMVITVENTGNSDLDISSVAIPSSDFSIQSENCTTLSPLGSNATCSISIDYTPSALGTASEDLSIASNDPDTPTLTAGLTGTGVPAPVSIYLTGVAAAAMEFNTSGDLFILADDQDTVYKYDTLGNLTTFATGLGAPSSEWSMTSDIVFAPNGNLLVSETINSTIYEVTPTGIVSTYLTGIAAAAMEFNTSGDLFILADDQDTVYKYDTLGNLTIFATGLGAPSSEWSMTSDIVFAPNGNLLVSETINSTIYEVTPTGIVSTYLTGIAAAAMEFNTSGDLFILADDQDTVYTYDTLGNLTIFATGLGAPSSEWSMTSDIVFAPNGNLLVSETINSTIYEVDTGIETGIDLELTKSVDNASPFVGSTVTFTVALTNNGPADATGVSVEDLVPNGYSNIQNISNGGTEAGGTITWSGLNINSGITINLTFKADVNASGDYKNIAQVTTADQTDSDSIPNNDDGDQSEDDEDNALTTPPGCSFLVRNLQTLSEYCTIQEAYNEAGDNHTIRSQAVIFTEDVSFNIDKTVIVDGGYDSNYSVVIGNTTIRGDASATSGMVTIGNVVLE